MGRLVLMAIKLLYDGGSAILTNDANLARRAKHLTTVAKLPHAWNLFMMKLATIIVT